MDWFGNIKKQPLEIVKASDSTLITSNPEDMFNVIHVQVISNTVQSASYLFPALLCFVL